MLLSSVILILREVLEAAILISLLLALSQNLRLGMRWLLAALPLSLMGTLLFAASLDDITDRLDGAGQEVANATIQGLVYCFSLAIILAIAHHKKTKTTTSLFLQTLMVITVTAAMIREGSEIFIYISGFARIENLRSAVFIGSAMGAGIGISLGVLIFAILRAFKPQHCYRACLTLLSLIGAGMVMQAAMLLEQVDWIPTSETAWDSSFLLREQSITGELLYAVFGYEATPSLIQISIYFVSLSVLVAACFYNYSIEAKTNES